jgi:hypothetical protein
MLDLLKNNILRLKYYLYELLIKFFLRLNFFYLCSLVIKFNLKKIKKIKSDNTKKKIIVLAKSGGYEDLIACYRNNNISNNIEFFTLPRALIKSIYHFYLSSSAYGDYLTLQNDTETIKKNNQYKFALEKIFFFLDKNWKFDGLIGFNIFYYAEHNVHEIINKINKKSIVLHKESVVPEVEYKNNEIVYKKNEKFKGNKISVYSNSEKELLEKTEIAKPDQIAVNGCPRLDLAFEYQKTLSNQNTILYYMVEKERPIPGQSSFVNWDILKFKTDNCLINYAKNNPKINIIFKGKVGVHKRKELPVNLPSNCKFINFGTGNALLKEAKVVIGFNSSAVYEAIAANRFLIVPNFNINSMEERGKLLNLPSEEYLVNNEAELNNKLDQYLQERKIDKKLSEKEKDILFYYFGNKNGDSGLRTRRFIENTLYN